MKTADTNMSNGTTYTNIEIFYARDHLRRMVKAQDTSYNREFQRFRRNLHFESEHHLAERGKPIPWRVVGNVANSILQKTPTATGKVVRSSATSADGSGKKHLTAF